MSIQTLLKHIKSDFGLRPVTAAEIEFYLRGAAERDDLSALRDDMAARCHVHKWEKERGHEQFEAAWPPADDPVVTADQVKTFKAVLTEAAEREQMMADFSAKPLSDQPGSGLHIHIHLIDANGKNVFYKDDHTMSDALKHSIGGLLAWLPEVMPVFAPDAESYARFVEKSNAPVTASWGANNRTVAIRLPDKPHANKHIEHRVAGADADPHAVIAVILAAIHDGLSRSLDPGAQIHGDASLPMYRLPRLPQTLEAGIKRMKMSEAVARYFKNAVIVKAQ